MVRVTELERLLTRISGLSGPVKDITRVSIIANSSQSNEVLNRKRIHPYFHLVTCEFARICTHNNGSYTCEFAPFAFVSFQASSQDHKL